MFSITPAYHTLLPQPLAVFFFWICLSVVAGFHPANPSAPQAAALPLRQHSIRRTRQAARALCEGRGWDQARPPCGVSMREGFNNAYWGRSSSLSPSHSGPLRARRAPPAPQPSQGPGPAAGPDGRPQPGRLPPPRLFGVPPSPATPRPALTCASQRRSWLYRALPSRKPSRHTEYSCKHTAVRPAPGPAGPRRPLPAPRPPRSALRPSPAAPRRR